MGPGRDRACDPWICSQTRICCQTRKRMRYAARQTAGAVLRRNVLTAYKRACSFSGLESTGMLCRYERAAMALARMRVCTGLSEFSLLAYSISTKLNSHVLMCTNKSLHINVVHSPASETSFKWRVAGGPNVVRYCLLAGLVSTNKCKCRVY